MARSSKRVKSNLEKIDTQKIYPVDEALALLKETSTAKFDETVEVDS